MPTTTTPTTHTISAAGTTHRELNDALAALHGDIRVEDTLGQRFIAAGASGDRKITITGVPGNALGAYLDGPEIVVEGNAQDAVGDTMNKGRIVIHGSIGDAAGYAMRGGEIYVRGGAGYRAGIHMKAYGEHVPVIVIGGGAGSFLGEYQAGGIIIVLGIGVEDPAIGYFCGTGMHGGKIFLRCHEIGRDLPTQVKISEPTEEDYATILPYINNYETLFGTKIPNDGKAFVCLAPNTANPYKQMYVQN